MTSYLQRVPTLGLVLFCLGFGIVPSAAQPSGGLGDSVGSGEEREVPEGVVVPEAVASEGRQQPDMAELERRVNILAEELERLRSGEQVVELSEEESRTLGLAPSAAATYARGQQGVSIAGYGEMLYENYADKNQGGMPTGKTTKFDYLRTILYAGYRFNDKFLFNSEIEVEHAKEIYVEFAYIDYLMNENFGLRGGMLLVPMGLVNEFHEPTVFMGAERPVTEQVIIPSTWRENGGGFYGSTDKVSYRGYFINGLNGAKFSASGLRGGRQQGAQAKATDMAFTGRLDVTPTPGVFLGASFYTGGSSHGEVALDSQVLDIPTTIFDFHAQAQVRGFDARALYAKASLGEAKELNMALGKTGTSAIAESMHGGYVQVGYNLLSQVSDVGGVALTPYLRLEKVDTQGRVPVGFSRSLTSDNRYTTLGLQLKPIPQVVVKVDHMWVTNGGDTGVNQFNVSLGYAF